MSISFLYYFWIFGDKILTCSYITSLSSLLFQKIKTLQKQIEDEGAYFGSPFEGTIMAVE